MKKIKPKHLIFILIPIILVVGALVVTYHRAPSTIASALWQPEFSDGIFTGPEVVTAFDAYRNRTLTHTRPSAIGDDDVKLVFHTDDYARFVNKADGYAVTLPKPFTPDFRWSAIRSRFTGNDFILNITLETGNPYGNNANSWEIYRYEWLEMYLVSDEFLENNNLSRTRHSVDTESMPGYTIYLYTMQINDRPNIEFRYYNIAAIRQNGEYVRFVLLHHKSTVPDNDRFDSILQSFRSFEPSGTAQNDPTPFIPIVNENWSEETRSYYELLRNQDTVDWGFFTNVLIDTPFEYEYRLHQLRARQDFLQNAFEHTFQIMPTYVHVGGGGQRHGFPTRMATEVAGGNGFNGRPVIQVSYQFTISNNDPSLFHGYTPVFNILNGDYDDNFRLLAQEIKAYGYPVLFRLNNEMDSDWVSYSAIKSLLCTDIFAWGWAHLYNIFEEEGVDNAIWVFETAGPDAIPNSSWGHGFNYLPHDMSMMHILSVISYEMGNNASYMLSAGTFANRFQRVYERTMPYFSEFPWAIGEFACGSGGEWNDTERFRNASHQAIWVEEMFDVFNNPDHPAHEYIRRIKFAVWFSSNDVAYHNGVRLVTNQLRIEPHLELTLESFRRGFAAGQSAPFSPIIREELPVTGDYLRLRGIDEWSSHSGGHPGHDNGITITENPDGGLIFTSSGTHGWPNIVTWSANPKTIPQAEWGNYTLHYDFTVSAGREASILLISNGRDDIRLTEHFLPRSRRNLYHDMPSGTYQGSIRLDELLAMFNYAEDMFEVAGIRIFAVGGADTVVTVREMRIE
ncbi:MAG: glycoside hydrolase family 26 protein [Oscillospiraceae bacterium]|nr:glycoside hydrolase family 26 protein [Oscillospiraceae bacterium]